MEMIQNLSDRVDSMEEKLLQLGELFAIISISFIYVTFRLLESHIINKKKLTAFTKYKITYFQGNLNAHQSVIQILIANGVKFVKMEFVQTMRKFTGNVMEFSKIPMNHVIDITEDIYTIMKHKV